MSSASPRFGCNVIDPLLEVGPGSDYSLPITQRSLALLAEVGFEGVEYSHYAHWSDADVAEVARMTADLGLAGWSVHAAFFGGNPWEQGGLAGVTAMLRHAGEVALALGARVVVHHPTARATDDTERLDAELSALAGAWQPGFRFALENLAGRAQMDAVLALVDQLGPERAGVCVDTGHANLHADLGAPLALQLAGARLITTHLQDNHGQHDEHRPPGDGDIDWTAVGDAIAEIGYQGCLMLELTDHPSDDRRPGFRPEFDRARAMVARLEARRRP